MLYKRSSQDKVPTFDTIQPDQFRPQNYDAGYVVDYSSVPKSVIKGNPAKQYTVQVSQAGKDAMRKMQWQTQEARSGLGASGGVPSAQNKDAYNSDRRQYGAFIQDNIATHPEWFDYSPFDPDKLPIKPGGGYTYTPIVSANGSNAGANNNTSQQRPPRDYKDTPDFKPNERSVRNSSDVESVYEDPFAEGGRGKTSWGNSIWRTSRSVPQTSRSRYSPEAAYKLDALRPSGTGKIVSPKFIDNTLLPIHEGDTTVIQDGNRFFSHTPTILNPLGDWSKAEQGLLRLPNPQAANVPWDSAPMSSSLVNSTPKGSGMGTPQFVNLKDIATDQLLMPGTKVPLASSREASDILERSVGEARRKALTDAYEQKTSLLDLDKRLSYSNTLKDMSPYTLPISLGGYDPSRLDLKYIADFERVHTPASSNRPLTGPAAEYYYGGNVGLKSGNDLEESYNPGSKQIHLVSGSNYTPPGFKGVDHMGDQEKFNYLRDIDSTLIESDYPANAFRDYISEADSTYGTLIHEGNHAATPYLNPEVGTSLYKSIVDAKRKTSDSKKYSQLNADEDELRSEGHVGGLMDVALGTVLANDTPFHRGYGERSTGEALRELHEFKLGLIRDNLARGLEPEEAVKLAQDPDFAARRLSELTSSYVGNKKDMPELGIDSLTGRIWSLPDQPAEQLNPDEAMRRSIERSLALAAHSAPDPTDTGSLAKTTYKFPAHMTSKARELEFARTMQGLDKMMHGRDDYDTDFDGRSVIRPILKRITPGQRREMWDIIWPQVRNNNPDAAINFTA